MGPSNPTSNSKFLPSLLEGGGQGGQELVVEDRGGGKIFPVPVGVTATVRGLPPRPVNGYNLLDLAVTPPPPPIPTYTTDTDPLSCPRPAPLLDSLM